MTLRIRPTTRRSFSTWTAANSLDPWRSRGRRISVPLVSCPASTCGYHPEVRILFNQFRPDLSDEMFWLRPW